MLRHQIQTTGNCKQIDILSPDLSDTRIVYGKYSHVNHLHGNAEKFRGCIATHASMIVGACAVRLRD
jgi:hypothetical protein